MSTVARVVAILLFSCVYQESVQFSGDTTYEVISALHAYFASGCVVFQILQQETQIKLTQLKLLNELRKYVSERGALTSVHARDVNGTVSCRRNGALHVILSAGYDAGHLMQEVFSRLHPSDVKWLLFIENTSVSVEVVLEDLNIPFDCEFLVAMKTQHAVHLSEAYRVHPTLPVVVSHWGTWSPEDGLQAPKLSLVERRTNLQGINFVAAAIDITPRQYLEYNSSGHLKVTGLFVDICREIARRLNFSLAVRQATNNAFGIQDENGSWTGLMGMMLSETINMSVIPITQTQARSQVVDFTTPVYSFRASIYIRSAPYFGGYWKIYTNPFDFTLWLSVVSCFLLILLQLEAIYYLIPSIQHYSMKDVLTWTVGSFCNQGVSRVPALNALRYLLFTIQITALLLSAAYKANFTSFLAVRKEVLPFTDLEGLLRDQTYGFGLLTNSAPIEVFKGANGTMREIYNKYILSKDLPKTDTEGFQKLCREKYAYMAPRRDSIASLEEVPCDISMLPWDSVVESASYVLPKRSPYRRIINHTIQKMMGSGVYRRLYSQWLQPVHPKELYPYRSAEFDDIWAVLLICIGGIVMALTVLLVEIVLTKFNFRKHRSHR